MVIEGTVSGIRDALTPGVAYVNVVTTTGGECALPMTREEANAHKLGDKLRVNRGDDLVATDLSPATLSEIDRGVSILEERIKVVDGRLATLQDERRSLYTALSTMRRVREQMVRPVVEFTGN